VVPNGFFSGHWEPRYRIGVELYNPETAS
jgi:hypothetical protein